MTLGWFSGTFGPFRYLRKRAYNSVSPHVSGGAERPFDDAGSASGTLLRLSGEAYLG